ncbi:EAL domain-containing protein, partial [Candidatus Bandiella numerosa]|uniref:EAL domain-containing protein n=1 Tax=Candidatus Bandiella numerosa TaxID=2570586 RepID=UPI001F2672FE
LFSIRSSASLTKNDILPPLSYVLIFSFYHICFFLPIMQWSLKGLPDKKDNILILRTLIGFAKSLNLEIIAEHVEKESTAKFLADEGVNYLQGYLFL